MANRLEYRRPGGPTAGYHPANASLGDVGAPNALDSSRTPSVVASIAELGHQQDLASSQPGVLFEQEVNVQIKLLDREEVSQPLTITLTTGRAGPHNVTRCVTIRITDPRDPFFLFVMTLLEDDYGRFKEDHELNADFAGFPRYLVALFNSTVDGHNPYTVTFVVQDQSRGILRVLERQEFRSLEYLKLSFLRQGDDGQKRYLAEKFQFFHAAFNRSEQERSKITAQLSQLVQDLKHDVVTLTSERDEARQQVKLQSSASQTALVGELASLKEKHNAELQEIRRAAEEEKAANTKHYVELLHEEESKRRELQAELASTSSRLQATQAENNGLSERVGRLVEAENRLRSENEEMKAKLAELQAFQKAATQRMTDNDLNSVATGERLRHYAENLKDREEELRTLREQSKQQEQYSRVLTEQLESCQQKLKETEASLAKAHHIIKTMLSNQEVAKQKYSAVQDQLSAKEEILREKENALERQKGELGVSQEKVEQLQGKVTELKEQLLKAEDTNQTLTAQLRQNEQALLHINRQTSAIGQRSWPTFGGTSSTSSPQPPTAQISAASSFLTAPANLHREFAKGLYASSGAGAGPGLSGVSPKGNIAGTPPLSIPSGIPLDDRHLNVATASATSGLRPPPFFAGRMSGALGMETQLKPTATAGAAAVEPPSAYFPSA
jgi:spindle assembly abnormal protein 6